MGHRWWSHLMESGHGECGGVVVMLLTAGVERRARLVVPILAKQRNDQGWPWSCGNRDIGEEVGKTLTRGKR